jgi:putative transposase
VAAVLVTRYRRGMQNIFYARCRFPPLIIQHVVWLYFRLPLSFRDVEDLFAERGINTS